MKITGRSGMSALTSCASWSPCSPRQRHIGQHQVDGGLIGRQQPSASLPQRAALARSRVR